MQGFDCWELVATNAKLPEAAQLRPLATALDPLDWRRRLRLLREDNNTELLLSQVAEVDLESLTETQVDLLALIIWTHSPAGSEPAQASMRYLLKSFPEHYGPTHFWP